MAIAPIRFNFEGFIDRWGMLPYKSLFAREAPLLQNQPLCTFLQRLDEEEYEDIKVENIQIKSSMRGLYFYCKVMSIISFSLPILSLLGKMWFMFKAHRLSKQADALLSMLNLRKFSSDLERFNAFKPYRTVIDQKDKYEKCSSSASDSLLFSSIFALMTLFPPAFLYGNTSRQITENRLLRLNDKIRRINLERNRSSEPSIEIQLGRANDYFHSQLCKWTSDKSLIVGLIKK